MKERSWRFSQSLLGRVVSLGTSHPILPMFALLQASILLLLGAANLASRTDPLLTDGASASGDFAAFYTGGVLVREGSGPDLYDLPVQYATQNEHVGGGRSYWQPYLNPPALAIALAPATTLGYVASFRIFAVTQFLLLLGALLFLSRATPALAEVRFGTATALALTVAFAPILITTFGGQNTALTLALFCSIYAALRLEQQVLAGILLGLLTYKPQYALVVGVVLLVGGHFKTVAVSGLLGGLHYILGASVCGMNWPLAYLAALSEHGPRELAQNASWHFSIQPVVHHLAPGIGSSLATILGTLVVLGLLGAAGRKVSVDSDRYPAFFGMVVAGTMLVSPHLQHYEAGILALPVLLGLETILVGGRPPTVRLRGLLILGYFGYFSWRLPEFIGFQPLFLVLVILFFWSRSLVVGPPRAG